MILVIRISGLVEVPIVINEALFRMRLRKKYAAVLIKDNEENKKLLQVVRNFVAFGTIEPKTLVKLVAARAKSVDKKKKIDAEKTATQLETKSMADLGLKPFFALHPPRGGIDTKLHYPIRKGVLGDNKEDINKLVEKML